jgi:hypothetical protein
MRATLRRLDGGPHDTIGELRLNGRLLAFTLEDEGRDTKVVGETRIPAGVYPVRLRTEGGHHAKYTRRFAKGMGPTWHRGMLEVCDVPGFRWILIHIGNTHSDTAGCILVGDGVNGLGQSSRALMGSTTAYIRAYEALVAAAEANDLELEVLDPPRAP